MSATDPDETEHADGGHRLPPDERGKDRGAGEDADAVSKGDERPRKPSSRAERMARRREANAQASREANTQAGREAKTQAGREAKTQAGREANTHAGRKSVEAPRKKHAPSAVPPAAPPDELFDELSNEQPEASSALPHEPVVWKGLRLNPFQLEAVAAIQGGHDVLVSAPTGAGKTLVAEYAIEDAVRRGRRCIYTAPIKALSNQKYRDFRDDPAIDVGLMTGDVTIHPGAQVLIMTTEILRNAIFDGPEHLADVEYVVFDEVHYMDDFERGSVWEESLIFAPKNIRFICLSATVSNVDELGAWLSEIRERETIVIKSTRRPVPLAHRFYTARSGAFEVKDIERIRKKELDSSARVGRMSHKKHSRDGGRDGRHGRGRGREMQEPPDSRPLIDQLQHNDLLPALVFAFSRKDCERMAWNNAGRELLDVVETERMQALQEQLIALFQLDHAFLDSELLSMARRGLSYHHAGMLPIHKELVERMFTSGLLKLLFTTETFALGINMPARSVIFHSLRKFDGVSFDYLSTRDYMQMAGRAGRQGLDTEGLVYSLLSPKDLAEAPVKRLIAGRAEPVESRFRLAFSSILHLVERLGRARLIEAWEKSFNQFQHRASTKKRQDQNRRDQRRLLDAHVTFLEELGYVHGDELTARGRIAKLINGYELQVTELCFNGLLENLPVDALAVVIVGLIYEERRRGEQGWISSKLHGNVRTSVQREIHALGVKAAEHQIAGSIKMPDWGLTTVTQAWVTGTSFDEILEHAEMTPGDIVRTFRMAVQLMRQIRRAIEPTWDLHDRLGRAMDALNRDVVDARRQLELG